MPDFGVHGHILWFVIVYKHELSFLNSIQVT